MVTILLYMYVYVWKEECWLKVQMMCDLEIWFLVRCSYGRLWYFMCVWMCL